MEKIFYIAQTFGTLNNLALFTFGICIIALMILVGWYFNDNLYCSNKDETSVCKKWIKRSIIVAIVSIFIVIFVPSKKTYLFMVGGHALEEIAKNEQVQEHANKAINLLEQYLENKVEKSDK